MMATVFPSPTSNAMVDQSATQNFQPQGPRPRQYTPYIFQPNFLKQQMKQRPNNAAGFPDLVATGANSVPLNEKDRLGQAGRTSGLNSMSSTPHQIGSVAQNIIDEIGRKKGGRKVIDWTSSCTLFLQNRRFQRDYEDVPDIMPDTAFSLEMQSVAAYRSNPVTSIASKFIRSATNKMKCPVYKVVWTPDGRRLVTGSASGEFTLWNGIAFNFETILQAHDCPVRAMAWSKYDSWLITGDNQGYIKYWQLNMNNVKMYQAHKDQACRSVSFGPTDHKFATASDDGTVRVWDFFRCHEERILRGHGADVKQVAWHPMKGILASASKDLHTPVKLWDPKTGQSLTTLHAHKGTVMDVKWNQNGNWLLSASRDHLVKLYDIRNLKQEMQIFRGHKKEAFSVSWHPIHEDLFASGGSEGSILFWQVGEEKEAGSLEGAHDSLIWSLEWHPLGHVLVSGSNDHSTKFWSRSRPGDSMRDRYNLPLLPQSHEEVHMSTSVSARDNDFGIESSAIPGMGDADVAAAEIAKRDEEEQRSGIPGLDWSYEEKNEFERKMLSQLDRKKIPYARPVPRAFVAAWEANKEGAPSERPRSPRFRERDFERRRWRDRFDDRPRDRGPPFRRNGPEMGGDGEDDRIFVDGIEVGPDFDPSKIRSGGSPDRLSPGPEHSMHPPDRPRGPRISPERGRHPSFNDVGPPRGRPRGPEEKRLLREELYAEILRSGSERDIQLLKELEEYGIPLEEALDEEMYFDENGAPLDPIGDIRAPDGPRGHDMEYRRGPERPLGLEHFPSDGAMPSRMLDGDMHGRGRGFQRGDRGPGFPPERGRMGRRRSPPPRMRRGGGPPR